MFKAAQISMQMADWKRNGMFAASFMALYLWNMINVVWQKGEPTAFFQGFSDTARTIVCLVLLLFSGGMLVLALYHTFAASMFSHEGYFYMAFPFPMSAHVKGRLLAGSLYVSIVLLVFLILLLAWGQQEKGMDYFIGWLLLHDVPPVHIGFLIAVGCTSVLISGAEFCALLFSVFAIAHLWRPERASMFLHLLLYLLLFSCLIAVVWIEYRGLIGNITDYQGLLWRVLALGLLQLIQTEGIVRVLVRFLEKRYEI